MKTASTAARWSHEGGHHVAKPGDPIAARAAARGHVRCAAGPQECPALGAQSSARREAVEYRPDRWTVRLRQIDGRARTVRRRLLRRLPMVGRSLAARRLPGRDVDQGHYAVAVL